MITSQIDTAPKQTAFGKPCLCGLITSQIDTAPKRLCVFPLQYGGLITSQIDTAPKPENTVIREPDKFDYQSD